MATQTQGQRNRPGRPAPCLRTFSATSISSRSSQAGRAAIGNRLANEFPARGGQARLRAESARPAGACPRVPAPPRPLASRGRTSERASGPGQVRTRPRRTWRGRRRPRTLLAAPGRSGRARRPREGPRRARQRDRARPPGGGDGGGARGARPNSPPTRQVAAARRALGRGPPGRPGHCPRGPRPPTRGGGQAAAEREQQQRRRRPGRRRLHVVRGRPGPRRAHSGSMARRGGSSRGSGACRLPLGRRGPGRRGRRAEARERKPRRVSAPRRCRPPARAPRAGRALPRAPPGAGRRRGGRGALCPRPSLRPPPPPGLAAGVPRGLGVGLRDRTPAGPGARKQVCHL